GLLATDCGSDTRRLHSTGPARCQQQFSRDAGLPPTGPLPYHEGQVQGTGLPYRPEGRIVSTAAGRPAPSENEKPGEHPGRAGPDLARSLMARVEARTP